MINEGMSYLLGVYFGDGHIAYVKKPKPSYQLSIVTEDNDLCSLCNDIIYEEFHKNGKVRNIDDSYLKLVVCSKNLCNFILNLTCSNKNFYNATRHEKKAIIPNVCPEPFIRGLMDTDGWISKRKNGKYIKYEIGFKNTSILSKEFRRMMIDCGLKCNKLIEKDDYQSVVLGQKCHCKKFWAWTINNKSYIEKVGFGIKRKQDLCKEYMEYMDGNQKNI